MLFAISAQLAKVLVVMSVFGAVVMYFFVLIAYFKLKFKSPLARPAFSAPVFLACCSFALCFFFIYSVLVYSIAPAHVSFMGINIPALGLVLSLGVISMIVYSFAKVLKQVSDTSMPD
jgi:amino acid transporter